MAVLSRGANLFAYRHLVPLERSNIAMLLGSSGVVRASENILKNICENTNRHVHGGVHLVVLAHLQRIRC